MQIMLIDGGRAPQRMSDGAAGYDVFARRVDMIGGPKVDIRLGFAIDCNGPHVTAVPDSLGTTYPDLPLNFAALLLPRSGWGAKYGFGLRNTLGVIDPDYRGEVIMCAEYQILPPELRDFEEGQELRVGQLLIVPCYVGGLQMMDKLSETARGANGFGSTGQ